MPEFTFAEIGLKYSMCVDDIPQIGWNITPDFHHPVILYTPSIYGLNLPVETTLEDAKQALINRWEFTNEPQ